MDREQRLAESESALLERRRALPATAGLVADGAVDWDTLLSAREGLAAERAETLLNWSAAIGRAVATPDPAPAVFWESLSERLGVVLAHELPELGASDVNEVIERALSAVGVAVRSRPPSAAPPALRPSTATAVDEEAELLAGVGGSEPTPDVEESPSMGSFFRALDEVLPDTTPAPRVPPPSLNVPPPLRAQTPAPKPAPEPFPEPEPFAEPEPFPEPDMDFDPATEVPGTLDLTPPVPLVASPPAPRVATPPVPEAAPQFVLPGARGAFSELSTLVELGPASEVPSGASVADSTEVTGALLDDFEVKVPPAPVSRGPLPQSDIDDLFATFSPVRVQAVTAATPPSPPVDDFGSFSALTVDLHSAIEQSVEAILLQPTKASPAPPLAPVNAANDHEMAMRMTEEVHLTDADIAELFSARAQAGDPFAFEMAGPPPPAAPPRVEVRAPVLAKPTSPPGFTELSDDDDPFADLAAGLAETSISVPPRPDVTDDPFAEIAAELEAELAAEMARVTPAAAPVDSGPTENDDPFLFIEPILGYDTGDSTPLPPPELAPERESAPEREPAPESEPPARGRSPGPLDFRPTLGRVERARTTTGSLRPPARPADRGAATFAAMAAELDIAGVDPWRELDISDLRSSGHPGPLPIPDPAPVTLAAPPERVQAARNPRAKLAVKVGIEYGTSFFTGFSGNVSRAGLYVATHQSVPVGERVELFFEMPDGHAVGAPAVVRWARDAEQAALDGSSPGLGLAFVGLSHDDTIILERFVAAHAASVLYDEAGTQDRY